jgi:hypothetical protein
MWSVGAGISSVYRTQQSQLTTSTQYAQLQHDSRDARLGNPAGKWAALSLARHEAPVISSGYRQIWPQLQTFFRLLPTPNDHYAFGAFGYRA